MRNEACKKMQDRIALWVQGDLSAGAAEAVRAHLEGCAACRAYAEALRTDDRILEAWAASLGDRLESLQRAALDEVARSQPGPMRSRPDAEQWVLRGIAAAAVLVIGILVAQVWWQGQGAEEGLPSPAGPSGTPAHTEPQGGLLPLPIKLPVAMFPGTPRDLPGVPDLEPPRGKDRPAFRAPADVWNVALHKPVTSSDPVPIMGRLDMVTDGDKEASEGHYVELGPMLQHVTIDLGDVYELFAIVVWHYHKEPRAYFDVIVQAAKSADFADAVVLFNNDRDNSAGWGLGDDRHYVETNEGRLIDAKGVRARYVRLYSNGNNDNELNHYCEVEVYGRPAVASPMPTPKPVPPPAEGARPKNPADAETTGDEQGTQGPTLKPLNIQLPQQRWRGTPESIKGIPRLEPYSEKKRPPFLAPAGARNLALGKPVTGTDLQPVLGELEQITDGDKEALDGSLVELGPFAQHVTIDLGEVCELYAVVMWHFHHQQRVYFDVIVQASQDPDFVEMETLFNNDHDNSLGLGVGKDRHYVDDWQGRLVDAKGVHARYVRLHSQGNSHNDLNHYTEVEVWGRPLTQD